MENLRGILLMVAAMAGFAIEDMFIKFAAADLPTGQILLMISLVGTTVFAVAAQMQGNSVFSRQIWHPAVVTRNLGEMIGTWGFIAAITLIPLSTVSAILQAMPLAVTCGAALFLGEMVGWRRWSAILVGFVGVIIILKPNPSEFDVLALLAVVAVIGLTVRDLATRRIPGEISTMQVAAWGFAAVGVLGAIMLAISRNAVLPDALQTGLVACAVFFGVLAYWAIVQAMRMGEVSVITPFRYSRLVFALIISTLVFHETIDMTMIIGASLIIGSGLYTFARERRVKRLPKGAAAG